MLFEELWLLTELDLIRCIRNHGLWSWLYILNSAVLSLIESLCSLAKLRLISLIFSAHGVLLDRHFKHFVLAYCQLADSAFIACLNICYLTLTLDSIERLFAISTHKLARSSKRLLSC